MWLNIVIPAHAGIQLPTVGFLTGPHWIAACAAMTRHTPGRHDLRALVYPSAREPGSCAPGGGAFREEIGVGVQRGAEDIKYILSPFLQDIKYILSPFLHWVYGRKHRLMWLNIVIPAHAGIQLPTVGFLTGSALDCGLRRNDETHAWES